MEGIVDEARRLRRQCADPSAGADQELTGLRRRYLRLLEHGPVPSDPLRHDIRRDLARSAGDSTRAMVVALLLAAVAVVAFGHWLDDLAPALASTVGQAIEIGLLFTIPATVAHEADRWRSSLRLAARSELNALLPDL